MHANAKTITAVILLALVAVQVFLLVRGHGMNPGLTLLALLVAVNLARLARRST